MLPSPRTTMDATIGAHLGVEAPTTASYVAVGAPDLFSSESPGAPRGPGTLPGAQARARVFLWKLVGHEIARVPRLNSHDDNPKSQGDPNMREADPAEREAAAASHFFFGFFFGG